MSVHGVERKSASLNPNFFNPYAGMAPPECCYCAPTGIPISQNTTNITNITNNPAQVQAEQQAIQIEVNASIQQVIPGLSNLAFMTKVEAGMRTLERGRIEARNGKLVTVPGAAEMGHGPFFYNQNVPRYVP